MLREATKISLYVIKVDPSGGGGGGATWFQLWPDVCVKR